MTASFVPGNIGSRRIKERGWRNSSCTHPISLWTSLIFSLPQNTKGNVRQNALACSFLYNESKWAFRTQKLTNKKYLRSGSQTIYHKQQLCGKIPIFILLLMKKLFKSSLNINVNIVKVSITKSHWGSNTSWKDTFIEHNRQIVSAYGIHLYRFTCF